MNWPPFKLAELMADISLLPHQERLRDKMRDEPAVLAYHVTGAGKTIGSIAAGEDIPGPKTVVVPASLRENFRKELARASTDPSQYDILSYDKATRHGVPPGALTIWDEAARMGRAGTHLSKLVDRAVGKQLFLSGTPIRNDPSEFTPILRALAADRGAPKTHEEFKRRFMGVEQKRRNFFEWITGKPPELEPKLVNQDLLKKMLRGRVDYQGPSGDYPRSEIKDVAVEMSPEQHKLYAGLTGKLDPVLAWKIRNNLPASRQESANLNAFLAAARQVSNNPSAYDTTLTGDPVEHSPKLKQMADEIVRRMKEDKDFKAVAYSNYLDSGLNPLAERLKREKIPAAVFSGQLGDPERKRLVSEYNAGKLRALLLSGAGSEGLDLKGTRLLQVMEPHFNKARIDQVLGRAVRHRSHSHLPEKDRLVEIQRYFAEPRRSLMQRLGLKAEDKGADRYLAALSDRKQRLNDQLLDLLKEVGSEPAKRKRKPKEEEQENGRDRKRKDAAPGGRGVPAGEPAGQGA